jgi:hypothetical protein
MLALILRNTRIAKPTDLRMLPQTAMKWGRTAAMQSRHEDKLVAIQRVSPLRKSKSGYERKIPEAEAIFLLSKSSFLS